MSEETINRFLSDIQSKILPIILLFIIFYLLKKYLKYTFKRISKKYFNQFDSRAQTAFRVLESSTNYFLIFVTAYFTLSIIGVPISTLLAGAGIAGLAIGLGAQYLISDLVNGFFIIIEDQFSVGDNVIISGIEGRVKSIGLRLTTLIGLDGSIYYIRNKDINIVNNLSKSDARVIIQLFIKDISALDDIENQILAISNRATSTFELKKTPTHLGLQTAPNGTMYYSIAFYTPYENSITLKNQMYQYYINALHSIGIQTI